MTTVVYKYRPLSMRSLCDLLEYEFGSEDKRFYRYVSPLLRAIACHMKLDKDRTPLYADEAEKAYKYDDKKQDTQTGQSIVANLIGHEV